MSFRVFCLILGAAALGGAAVLGLPPASAAPPSADDLLRRAPSPETLEAQLKRFAPVEIGVVKGRLPAAVEPMIPHLVAAADQVDAIFWEQVSPEGRAMHEALSASKALGADALAGLLEMNYGPWDRFGNDRALIARLPRPAGANLYPSDVSRAELDAWIADHPKDADAFKSPHTVIRRDNGRLVAVPYSDAYLQPLKASADALRAAAASYRCSDTARARGLCECDDLAAFLLARAEAFLTDNYRPSELAWVEATSCPLDLAIGPYEFYEDRLLGQKAAFEAILTLRDPVASKRFAKLADAAPGMLANLPVSEAVLTRLRPVPQAPITVADLIYSAGDARAGYQMRAFVLPNDEAVRLAKGQKHVILHNVVRAKFDALVKPLAKRVLDPKSYAQVSFDAYFDLLLAWQLSHAVVTGPIVQSDGTTSTSRQLLRERYTIIEGVKGEALALWNYFQLADLGLVDDKKGEKLAATYLASLFDAARQATDSPQAIARTIVYNHLVREWVLRYQPMTQTFEVRAEALREATRKLAAEALEILARGDYHGAGRLIVEYGIVAGELRQKLATLTDVPLEIRPIYRDAKRTASATPR